MATQSETSGALFLLNTLDDYQEHILGLLKQGRASVFLFSRELNPLLFNTTAIIEEISAIARRTGYADIRLLIEDPQMVVESNHKLLQLSRRLPSKIKIQKLTIDPPDAKAFMIVDDNKVWLQHDENIISAENSGFANYEAKPEAKNLEAIFKDLWRYSESDVRLRQLSL